MIVIMIFKFTVTVEKLQETNQSVVSRFLLRVLVVMVVKRGNNIIDRLLLIAVGGSMIVMTLLNHKVSIPAKKRIYDLGSKPQKKNYFAQSKIILVELYK
ncbi:hypothetical protein BLOT_013404 [Blomia tropicalis]|nr:hypothetical protein BLOT_013404 [Blomia tropicalis]